MCRLVSRQERRIGGEREMDTGETKVAGENISMMTGGLHSRYQVGLELVEINVERSIEAQRSGDGRNNLSDQAVKVGEAGRDDAQFLLANVVNSLVIDLHVGGLVPLIHKRF